MIADSLHIRWSPSTVDDVLDLIVCNNAPDYRSLPVIVEANQCARALCSSNVGLANTLGTPNGVSSGPMARIMTLFGWLPWTMKPPIITLSSVWTKLRVLMLASMDVAGARVSMRHGCRTRRWRCIDDHNGACHPAASTMRSAIVRKRPDAIEGANEGRSPVHEFRSPICRSASPGSLRLCCGRRNLKSIHLIA